MNIFILCNVVAVAIAGIAQMMLKYAVKKGYKPFWREYINIWVIGGYVLMMSSLLLNIFGMSKGIDLKFLTATEALGYLFIPMLSYFVFGEKIGKSKMLAIALIVVGVIVFFI